MEPKMVRNRNEEVDQYRRRSRPVTSKHRSKFVSPWINTRTLRDKEESVPRPAIIEDERGWWMIVPDPIGRKGSGAVGVDESGNLIFEYVDDEDRDEMISRKRWYGPFHSRARVEQEARDFRRRVLESRDPLKMKKGRVPFEKVREGDREREREEREAEERDSPGDEYEAGADAVLRAVDIALLRERAEKRIAEKRGTPRDKEIDRKILDEYLDGETDEEIAESIGSTPKATKKRRQRLGLPKLPGRK